jgi:hypothetical protein
MGKRKNHGTRIVPWLLQQWQLIELDEFLNQRVRTPAKLRHGSEKSNPPFGQKHDAVGQLASEFYVVRHHDGGDPSLPLQLQDQVAHGVRHQRIDHLDLVRAFDFFPAFYGQGAHFFWV